MREKISEKKLEPMVRKLCTHYGGLSLKFTSPSFTGVPDRICLFWKARIAFVEVKTTGNKPTARQAFVHKVLRKLGFPVFVVDDRASLKEFEEWITDF